MQIFLWSPLMCEICDSLSQWAHTPHNSSQQYIYASVVIIFLRVDFKEKGSFELWIYRTTAKENRFNVLCDN